jgi:hypothetical protein
MRRGAVADPAAGPRRRSLFVDLISSEANLPAGTRLALSAVIEVTAEPHTGCAKFVSRWRRRDGSSTHPLGRELHLRGINAKVITAGASESVTWRGRLGCDHATVTARPVKIGRTVAVDGWRSSDAGCEKFLSLFGMDAMKFFLG